MAQIVFTAEYGGYAVNVQDLNYTVAHNAATGGVEEESLYIGQNKTNDYYFCYRGFVFFDTSALDDDCLIESVTLGFTLQTDNSVVDFNVVVRTGSGGAPHNPLVSADYLYSQYSGNGGQINTSDLSSIEIELNSTGKGWINKIGWTSFALISSRDINSTQPDGIERVIFYGANSGDKPTLTVVYFISLSIPVVGDPSFSNIKATQVNATANVSDDGGLYDERGFEYGLTEVATWTKKEDGAFTGTGNFSLTIDEDISLPGTYYVRAYVKNSFGTGYSNWVKLEVVEYPEEGDWVAYTAYGEWVKFVTAAPGEPGDKPLGYKNDVCSDNSGYTYILNRSLLDDGASYKSHFVLSTDLSGKKTLHTNKRLLDIFSYFANKGTGTAKVYVKRDTEPEWQEAGEISLTGKEEIVIQHIPVDYLAKTYLIKFTFENDFEFIGSIFESIPIGDR